MAKYCKHCGEELGEGVSFCPGCGAAVDAAPVQDQYAQPQGQYAPSPQDQYAPPIQDQNAPQYDQYGQPMQNQYAQPQGQYAPPQGQYAQPQGQYAQAPQPVYVIPQLKLTKQHLLIIIIAIVAVVAVLLIVNLTRDDDGKSSGGKNSETVLDESEDDEDTGSEDTDGDASDGGDTGPGLPGWDDEGSVPVVPPINPPSGGGEDEHSVFDVSSFENLPFGTMSVNQVAAKYGTPDGATVSYTDGDPIANVMISYANVAIVFSGMDVSKFSSIGKTAGGAGMFELNAKDKDLQLEVSYIMIGGPGGGSLPKGLKMGESKKSDVVAAYGNNPIYEYSDSNVGLLTYDHTLAGSTGQVSFYFDSNELLSSIVATQNSMF